MLSARKSSGSLPCNDRPVLSNLSNSFEAAGWSFEPEQASPLQSRQLSQQLAHEAQEAELRPTPEGAFGSLQRRTSRSFSDRAAAAAWVNQLTGIEVPSDSDSSFRAALRDGLLLCRVLKALRPEADLPVNQQASSVTGSHIQSYENITKFMAALAHYRFPPASMFDRADLDAADGEERPQVVRCLMTLKKVHEAERTLQLTPRAQAARPLAPSSPAKPSISPATSLQPFMQPSAGPPVLPSHPPWVPQGSPRVAQNPPVPALYSPRVPQLSPWAVQSSPRVPTYPPWHAHPHPNPDATPDMDYKHILHTHFGSHSKAASFSRASLQAANHTTAVVQHAANGLADRLGPYRPPVPALPRYGSAPNPPTTSPEAQGATLETISPILENVLGSLTGEYEKKLFDKDQEMKGLQAHLLATQRELQAAHHDLHDALQRAPLPPVGSQPTPGESRELESALHRERALQADLRAAHRHVEQAQTEASHLRTEHSSMQAQVEEVQEALRAHEEVVAENRRLYNQVLDLKGNIRVFCRVRPLGTTGDPSAGCTEVGIDGEVAAYNPKDGRRKLFRFDKVFGPEASQETVYEDTSALIRSVLDGYNVCIFAYGQTGSGKTHTMAGTDVAALAGRGINYRALDDLFALNRKRANEVEYSVRVQLLEIYNEALRDLLEDRRTAAKLEIRSTERSGVNVPGARQYEVSTTEEVLDVMAIGARNRAVAETKMNERSSRSHSVLTVIVDGSNLATGERTHGCLHLIDLAGSERVGKSEATGDRLEEAKHINRSLSALGDVMAALAAKDRGHVPYRNSRLTQLLQDSLCGSTKVMMFVHVSPEETSFGESISTLQFGARVSEISLGAAKKNVESGAIFEARELARSTDAAMAVEANARKTAEGRVRTAEQQLDAANHEIERLRAELETLRSGLDSPTSAASLASTPSLSRDFNEATISAVYPSQPPTSSLHQAMRAAGAKASGRSPSMDLKVEPGSPRSPRSRIPVPPSSLLKAPQSRLSTGGTPAQPTSSPLSARRTSFPPPRPSDLSLSAAVSAQPSRISIGGGKGGPVRRTESEEGTSSPTSGSLTARSYAPERPSQIPRMPNSARGSMTQSTAPKQKGLSSSSSVRSSVSSGAALGRKSIAGRASLDGRAAFSRVPDIRSSQLWK